jgi:hypothetical protein
MAFDEGLAERIRAVLGDAPDVRERRMFGGLAVMVAGNMACGVIGDDLMVRVGRDAWASCLALPHAREMDLTGRTMTGLVLVDAEGVAEDDALIGWLDRGVAYAGSLPPK